MARFYLWVNLLSSATLDSLVASLVNEGFKVGPLASDATLTVSTKQDSPSCLVALDLEAPDSLLRKHPLKEGEALDCSHASTVIKLAIGKCKLKHLGYIVSLPVGCTWNAANFSLDKAAKPAEVVQTQFDQVLNSKLDSL
jgi:hypothetical protein